MKLPLPLHKSQQQAEADCGYQVWELTVPTGDPMGFFQADSELTIRVDEGLLAGDVIHCVEATCAQGEAERREKDYVIEEVQPADEGQQCIARATSADAYNRAVSVPLSRYEDLLGRPSAQTLGPSALDQLFNSCIALRNRVAPAPQEKCYVSAGLPLWLSQGIGLLANLNQVHCGYLYERELLMGGILSAGGCVQLYRANRKWLRAHDTVVRDEVTGAGAMALASCRVALALRKRSGGQCDDHAHAVLMLLLSAYDFLHELHQVSAVSRNGAQGPRRYAADPLHAQMALLRSST